jgi:hypothetical protein
MAATGFTPVSLYYSATASNVPLAANLVAGELAMNTNDGKLFYKDSSGVVQTMASKATGSIGGSTTQVQFNNAGVLGGSASLTWSGTVLTSSGFAGPLNGTVGATTANTGAFTTLSASSTVSGAGFSTYLASPPAIGGTAAAAGSFTTLNSTGGALNGSIGATTASTGAFTTTTIGTSETLSYGTANGVTYLNGSKVVTSGSALTFNGTTTLSVSSSLSGASNYMKVINSSNTANSGALLSLQTGGTSGGTAAIEYYNQTTAIYAGATTSYGYYFVGANADGSTPYFVANSTGLGIGTSSPGYKLDVVGSGNIDASVYGSNAARFLLRGSTSQWATGVDYYTSGAWVLRNITNNTSVLTADSSGNLGLGVTPSAWTSNRKVVAIGGTVAAINYAALYGQNAYNCYTDGTNYLYQTTTYAGQFNFNLDTAGAFSWRLAASGTAGNAITFTQAMTLDASGRLGIGTTSPTSRLSVNGAADVVALQVTNSAVDGNTADVMQIQPSNGAYYGKLLKITSGRSDFSDSLLFLNTTTGMNSVNGSYLRVQNSSSADIFRIGGDGNVGIGTSSPGAASGLTTRLDVVTPSGTATRIGLAQTGINNAGITIPASVGGMGFEVGATERMRIDSSGNLLVGATSSSGKLTVQDSGNSYIVLQSSTAGYANIRCIVTSAAGIIGTEGAFPFVFRTSDTERARIDTSGNLLVGTTTATQSAIGNGIQIKPDSAGGFINIGHNSSSSGYGYMQFLYGSTATVIGSISQSGTTAVLYNVTSDQRLKENIVDAPEFGSVIDSIKVRSYDWKADGNHQRAGFIAQELVTVAPEAVHQPADEEEMMAVDYSKLVPMLVKEIQSLRKRLADAGI